jgi:hypothetical protein|tara:strand:+ start:196 stop:378 length:183 start_codon:yes stop_codon:yes gene_type:complete
MDYSNTNYFLDMIVVVAPLSLAIYLGRKNSEGIWIFLKEIHENNLKDYEIDKVAREQENS